jgi:hypothetical protein
VGGEVTDREAFKAVDGGEVSGGAEDRLPAAFACGVPKFASRLQIRGF